MTSRAGYACAGLVSLAVLSAGCDHAGNDAARPKAAQRAVDVSRLDLRGAPVVGCAERNEAPGIAERPGPTDLRLGPVLLYRATELAALNASEFFPELGEEWAQHKVGVAVAAGARVTLATHPTARSRLGLAYAKPAPSPPFTVRNGGAAVSFSGCPATEPLRSRAGNVGKWTHFGGELLYSGPGCYRLVARDARRRQWHSALLRLGAVAC